MINIKKFIHLNSDKYIRVHKNSRVVSREGMQGKVKAISKDIAEVVWDEGKVEDVPVDQLITFEELLST